MGRRHPQLVLVGKRIREARTRQGLSQESLADLLDLDRAYVGRIERGEANIGLLNLLRIAFKLNVEPSLKEFGGTSKV
jgi:transcriptional regulator with XRE-family HTH domain